MAKGRKQTTMNRSDRYLGSYSYGDSHTTSVTDELELAEEDIWSPAVIHDTETDESYGAWNLRATLGKNGRVGGLSLVFDGSLGGAPSSSPMLVQQLHDGGGENRRKLASSAPVNVPDWSKIYRVEVESIHELDEEEEDEEESGMMPPHEYLAKSQARRSRKTGGGGASVFEGVGRTLKGRELRRVRDAIWSQTGFYG
ncbi:Protein S40-6 [Cardamine amara subsp. amara]|uniref:Protein S40-6 n=1 Tax=Cardamine amara subsp. amara TaxID=228776 RepID=A0ABD1C9I7_CARAN